MIAFYRAYPTGDVFSPPAVAKLAEPEKMPQPVAKLPKGQVMPLATSQTFESVLWPVPWAHHVVLIEKVKDLAARIWYMHQTLANGWSRNVLALMIDSDAHRRQGKAVSNFERLLPSPYSDLVQQGSKIHISLIS